MNEFTKSNKEVDLKILNTTELRLLFHKYIYNDRKYADEIMSIAEEYIDALVMEYNPSRKAITIKIKKTSMKKNSNFVHNTDYYYVLLNNIMNIFFSRHMEYIVNIAKENNYDTSVLDNYTGIIPGLYNLTCVSDNIVIIYL